LFEDQELIYPYFRLRKAGYQVVRIGVNGSDLCTGKHGVPMAVDCQAADLDPSALDALHIPGGYAPDHIRRDPAVVPLVQALHADRKPIAAICHGPWLLASAEVVNGRSVTSFFAIADDLRHAGANWVDRETVVDGHLVTARNPDDLPAYMRAFLVLIEARLAAATTASS